MRAVVLVMLAGCQLVFEQLPEPIDSGELAIDAAECVDYQSVGAQTSRYRIIMETAPRDAQTALCEADGSRAHLVVLDTAQETVDIIAFSAQANLVWVALRQAPGSPSEDVGWSWDRTDAPLDLGVVNWAVNEPDDGGGIEDDAENIAALGGAGLFDLPATDKRAAICECD